MTEYERGFIDGIKSKVSAELTPTLINVSKTMLEMLKPVLSTALENALNDNNAITDTDVQPVKRGEWDFRGYQLFKCTNCKEIFTQNQLETMQNHIDQEEFTFPNFCPNCGADMRGDTNG